MGVTTKQFIKKPLYVDAVRITRRNFGQVAKWCEGDIRQEDVPGHGTQRFIKLQAHNPINNRQTKAFVGDWLLKTERGFKVYTNDAFVGSFDEVVQLEHLPQKSYPHIDGGFTVIGPECFAAHDGSVLSWKGRNYVPQDADRSIEAQVQTEMERA